MSGFVYAVECGQRVKIGFSMKPELRFNKIASDAPFPCRLLGYWPATRADELDIQDRFSQTRVHGEWFASTSAILEFIAAHKVAANPTAKRSALLDKDSVLAKWLKARRGRLSRLAEELEINPSAILQWRAVPVDRLGSVVNHTGIPREQLRPDIFEAAE